MVSEGNMAGNSAVQYDYFMNIKRSLSIYILLYDHIGIRVSEKGLFWKNTLATREDGHPWSIFCPLEKVTLFTLLKAAGEEIPAIIGS